MVADKYLGSLSLEYLGWIPYDKKVPKTIRKQDTILRLHPDTPASKSFMALAQRLLSNNNQAAFEGDLKFFWHQLLNVSPPSPMSIG
jgi:flagellar biosynthesis protein FlhG